ncbi:hypothetical protein LXL04_003912 [Taraxacum kok-saghyz]
MLTVYVNRNRKGSGTGSGTATINTAAIQVFRRSFVFRTRSYSAAILPQYYVICSIPTNLYSSRLSTASIGSTLLHIRTSTITDLKSVEHNSLLSTITRSTGTLYTVPNIDIPLYQKGNDWFCPSDGKDPHPKFCFSLSATIADDSSSMMVMFSGDTVQTLSGSNCEHFVCDLGYTNRTQLPPMFNEYINNTYTFCLQFTRRAISVKENQFIATNVLMDTSKQHVSTLSPAEESPVVASSTSTNHSSPTYNTRKRLRFEHPAQITVKTPQYVVQLVCDFYRFGTSLLGYNEFDSQSPQIRECIWTIYGSAEVDQDQVWVEDESTWIEIHGVDQRKYMLSIKVPTKSDTPKLCGVISFDTKFTHLQYTFAIRHAA